MDVDFAPFMYSATGVQPGVYSQVCVTRCMQPHVSNQVGAARMLIGRGHVTIKSSRHKDGLI